MRKLILVAVLAAVVVISLGCISAPEKKQNESTLAAPTKVPGNITTLRIGYQPSTHQIAEMVAYAKGWWAEDLKPFGVTDIKEYQFPTGAPEMQAMLADKLDVAYVGTAPPITAIAKGMDAKIIAAANINGSNIVFRPGVNYTGPQSLVGLSIGTYQPGTIQDLVMRIWLKNNGVEASKIKILPMNPGDAVTAIIAGKVDGVFVPHPFPATIELEGKGKSVLASGQMLPNHACCSVIVSGKLIREHPELVEQIIKTHIKATDYLNAHQDEAAKIFANKTGQNLTEVLYSMKTWDGRWISDPNPQITTTVEYAKFDLDHGYINKTLTKEDLFDTSFYEKAKA